jgi:hypothetical protein
MLRYVLAHQNLPGFTINNYRYHTVLHLASSFILLSFNVVTIIDAAAADQQFRSFSLCILPHHLFTRSPMHCFFRISIAGNPPQTVVIQLHPDKCPITCRNFLQICKSDSIAKRTNAENLPTYRGTEIHRVVPNFMIQGGDFTSFIEYG